MPKIHHDIVQGTGAWLKIRIGKVTASELDNIVTPLFVSRKGETPLTYLCKQVAEAYKGYPLPDEQFYTHDTEQGQMLEDEARRFFCFTYDHEKITHPGFVEHDSGRFGCSPDALIGEDGGLEIKCPKFKTHVKYLMNGTLPDEYAAQVHGSMYATGRKSWTFFSYARGFPPFVLKVERDETICAKIHDAVREFTKRFDAALDQLRQAAA